MNNTIDSKELQEMKAQLALLTQKLEHETIVSQRQIRQSMKDKANYLHWFLIRESIISIIGIPFCLWILPNISRISMLFCATCAIFLAIELFYNCYLFRRLSPNKFAGDNLLEARKETLNFKKLTIKWAYWFEVPFVIVIFILFIYEKSHFHEGVILNIALTSGIIGFIIFATISYYHLRKLLRTSNYILSQIEELEKVSE